eukprot:757017-Hanusia_phi.AAC.3
MPCMRKFFFSFFREKPPAAHRSVLAVRPRGAGRVNRQARMAEDGGAEDVLHVLKLAAMAPVTTPMLIMKAASCDQHRSPQQEEEEESKLAGGEWGWFQWPW